MSGRSKALHSESVDHFVSVSSYQQSGQFGFTFFSVVSSILFLFFSVPYVFFYIYHDRPFNESRWFPFPNSLSTLQFRFFVLFSWTHMLLYSRFSLLLYQMFPVDISLVFSLTAALNFIPLCFPLWLFQYIARTCTPVTIFLYCFIKLFPADISFFFFFWSYYRYHSTIVVIHGLSQIVISYILPQKIVESSTRFPIWFCHLLPQILRWIQEVDGTTESDEGFLSEKDSLSLLLWMGDVLKQQEEEEEEEPNEKYALSAHLKLAIHPLSLDNWMFDVVLVLPSTDRSSTAPSAAYNGPNRSSGKKKKKKKVSKSARISRYFLFFCPNSPISIPTSSTNAISPSQAYAQSYVRNT